MAGESSRRASVAETNAAKKEKFFSRSVYTRIPYGTKNGARKKERKEERKRETIRRRTDTDFLSYYFVRWLVFVS